MLTNWVCLWSDCVIVGRAACCILYLVVMKVWVFNDDIGGHIYEFVIHTSSRADWISCTRHTLIVWYYVKPSMSVKRWFRWISSCVLHFILWSHEGVSVHLMVMVHVWIGNSHVVDCGLGQLYSTYAFCMALCQAEYVCDFIALSDIELRVAFVL